MEAIQELALTVPQEAPAPRVKEALLRRVQEAGSQGRRPALSAPAWGWWLAAGAAAVALLAFLSTTLLLLRSQMGDLEAQTKALSAAVQRQGPQPSPAAGLGGMDQYALVSLLAEPDRHVYWAERHVVYPHVRGMVLTSSDERWGLLAVAGLPALPPQQEYQVWLQRNVERVAAETFTVDPATGWAQVALRPAEPLFQFQTLLVTVEPRGGSSLPTSPPVFRAQLFPGA
jgi:anti-sigma-K factor RskA